jgi:cholinesterase
MSHTADQNLGWSIGGTNTPFYTGKYFADTEDVVVVTVNFRLNIFGYPGFPGGSQNLGLRDQRLAVEWIRDNAKAFGGDPNKITLMGQSSGGLAVDFWNFAYKKDPIVSGIISHSGNAYSFPLNSLALAEKNWYNASAQVGCGSAGDNLECMRQVNWTLISAAAAKVPPPPGTSQARSQPPFQATIDEINVFSDYYERNEAGNHAKIVSLAFLYIT